MHDRRCAPSPTCYGAPEYVELELFLMWRARGMTMESPGRAAMNAADAEERSNRSPLSRVRCSQMSVVFEHAQQQDLGCLAALLKR